MRISAALIVRDEAEHLPGCLDCVRQFAAEICVVDTGSADDTVDIARRYDAKLDFFPWTQDFSEARNRSLDLCTGDWVFVIDADERIAPQDMAAMERLVRTETPRGYRFVTRNYTNQTNLSDFAPCAPDDAMSSGFRGWTPSTKVRLFPNDRRIRFEGAVHELVNPALERMGIPLDNSPIPVHHYPLLRSAERLQRKQELYLELGRRKVAENPGNAKAYLELGNQYADLGNAVEAVRAYSEALRRAPGDVAVLRGLGASLYLAGRHAEAERSLQLALRVQPDSSEAWRNLGVVQGARENWAGAVECFRRALELTPNWVEGQHYLSVACDRAGLLEEAADAAERAVRLDPADAGRLEQYIAVMTRLDRRERAKEFLNDLARKGATPPALAAALESLASHS